MEVKNVAVSEIRPYEKNPRFNDGAVDDVAKSIEQFGFRQPIVVDNDGVIIAGHTRYKAALKLGLKVVPVVVADDLSEKQVAAYRLADNKTGQKATWDNKTLLEELDFIGDDFFTGFELGGLFDVLDENDNSVLDDNDAGVVYEITFKSQDREKIEEILQAWKDIADV